MSKRVLLAYAFWFLGGPLGLHHIYLGRDSHALLWMVTFGGFGMGWIWEFWQIPSYVAKANEREAMRKEQRPSEPPASSLRVVGQLTIGIYFGIVAIIGLSSFSTFYLIALPLAVGLGVHLVASVGDETSDLVKTLIASFITSPIFYGRPLATLPISITASVTSYQHRRYKTGIRQEENLRVRLYRLGLAYLAFTMPLSYCVFYNTTMTITYIADTIGAILDAVRVFPMLKSLLETTLLFPYHTWKLFTGGAGFAYGSFQEWEKIYESLTSYQNEKKHLAYKVLGLSDDATLDEINKNYRELVKIWHPDHNPQRLEEAEHHFIQIQAAYKTLMKLKKSTKM
ncbi:dnaJ homolog subfamily C member 22 [Latimeria chalumnae]|uniref:DnaJ homolog subfamily C member 22 n=1 Tax=Latimeria chalumnae TaxID=7897 RepID=H3BIE8_LATCH|nr:PREDICTED: dnaJ homolog subfamily C member 22 [Latimeria chalumnae]XP_014349696.1 PREDICTED: dnaJ homolog subfamily C member 22 [Latimeria chalumnae]|eukprot:XP_005986316.1 PREDICTED: dnaJ homolog subfamily C member 22 [Latimeria chalumnae]